MLISQNTGLPCHIPRCLRGDFDLPKRRENLEIGLESWWLSPWRMLIHMVPSGYVKIAIENDHRNSEFSH